MEIRCPPLYRTSTARLIDEVVLFFHNTGAQFFSSLFNRLRWVVIYPPWSIESTLPLSPFTSFPVTRTPPAEQSLLPAVLSSYVKVGAGPSVCEYSSCEPHS